MGATWFRRDSGDRLAILTPTVEIGHQEFVTVLIPLASYQRLVSWASVGRTLDAVESSCTDNDALSELVDLHTALSDCHQACRRHHLEHDSTKVIETKQ